MRFGGQKFLNLAILLIAACLGFMVVSGVGAGLGLPVVSLLFVFALVLGVAMTLPIGGADMPVVISLYNALTGLAVAFEGFVLDNAAMIIAGTVVGFRGHAADPAHGEGHEPLARQCAVLEFRRKFGGRRQRHRHAESRSRRRMPAS